MIKAGGGGVRYNVKRSGMLIVSHVGVNRKFWLHLRKVFRRKCY